jgi:hypothetical protein
MIIFLPVRVYEKCCNIPFNIELSDDCLTINTNNEIKIHNIVLCNFSYGITTLPISFPLIFYIVKNELICDQFYIFKILSTQNDFDFLNIIINKVNEKYNKKLILYKNLNLMNLINVLKLNTNNEIIDDNHNKSYYRVCRYLNFCLATMVDENTFNISDTSKILQIINLIKLIKINFYGNTLTIEEHIDFINHPNLIKKRKCYFYENNNKIIKIQIGENINKSHIKPYPNKYSKLITIKNLLNTVIINNFNKLFEISGRVLYKKKPHFFIMLDSYIFNNNNYIEYEITNNNYDNVYKLPFDKFKNIIDNNIVATQQIDPKGHINTQKIINDILNLNIYPINFDKKTLNENFIKLLYICIKNEDNIQYINHKLKSILFLTIKIYKAILIEDISILYNSRIYNENIIYQIMKIFLLSNNTNILYLFNNIKHLSNFKQKFINNIIIIQILLNLSWKTISKQFTSFKYLISMKLICKDLIIIDGKLNKYYTQTMDNRLKKIIIDPLLMFNYLKNEEDFYKWIFNFKDLIPRIFNNMITLNNQDYKKLAKILFMYSKIKNQNMEDEFYKKLLGILKCDSHLVLFNDRINIKFKDIFRNININLGFMARDIINEETISVTISENFNTINDNYNDNDAIHKLKRKYYKYKGKYLEMKITNIS